MLLFMLVVSGPGGGEDGGFFLLLFFFFFKFCFILLGVVMHPKVDIQVMHVGTL